MLQKKNQIVLRLAFNGKKVAFGLSRAMHYDHKKLYSFLEKKLALIINYKIL